MHSRLPFRRVRDACLAVLLLGLPWLAAGQAGTALALYHSTGAYQGDMWFPDGVTLDQIKQGSAAIPVRTAKLILRNRIDAWWPVLLKHFPFASRDLAYAFFIGEATLESTLNPGVETAIAPWGQNPAHAYGLLQTAETAYRSDFPGWMPEEVEGFPQAPLTPRNFYDPVISVDMGLRKACWFSRKAREDMVGKRGFAADAPLPAFGAVPDLWMLVLKGFNTGWATYDVQENGRWTVNRAWYDFYGTWSPAMSAWYLKEGHLDDDAHTWHTDPRVGPYLAAPYAWITGSVATRAEARRSARPDEGAEARVDALGRWAGEREESSRARSRAGNRIRGAGSAERARAALSWERDR
jgi:hypothetical protein